jgi:hypothetical protein
MVTEKIPLLEAKSICWRTCMTDDQMMIERDHHELTGSLDGWQAACKRVMRIEMMKRNITYRHLALMLCELGEEETEKSVTLKITRGTFRLSFFMKTMAAMGVDTITMSIPKLTEQYDDKIKRLNEETSKKR